MREDPADTAAFIGTTSRTSRTTRLDSLATLVEVRSSPHGNTYERIVFDFGDTLPGYAIEYTAAPAACGSGQPIDPGGSAFLSVRLEPARAHAPRGGDIESTVTRERTLGTDALRRLVLSCDFEGVVSWVVGLDRQRPYRAFTLEHPPRLVVDISTADATPPVSAERVRP